MNNLLKLSGAGGVCLTVTGMAAYAPVLLGIGVLLLAAASASVLVCAMQDERSGR